MPLPEALLTKMEYAVFDESDKRLMFGSTAAFKIKSKGVFAVPGVVKLTVSAA
jgi:hypothetical protein